MCFHDLESSLFINPGIHEEADTTLDHFAKRISAMMDRRMRHLGESTSANDSSDFSRYFFGFVPLRNPINISVLSSTEAFGYFSSKKSQSTADELVGGG